MSSPALLILHDAVGAVAQRWVLDAPAMTIGRDEANAVVLADREVSRRHAQVDHDGDHYTLTDLGSKNGTFVNGTPVHRATVLRDGDEILIAPRHRLIFVDSEATVPAQRPPRGLRIDAASRGVTIDGQPIDPPLTATQFALLTLLAREPGRVYTRDEVIEACYPFEDGVSDQAVDGLVRRVRSRIAAIDPSREYVVVVRGHGVRLVPEP